MIRFVDLFCGIGGIRLALENACKGLMLSSECVASSEIDSRATEAYSLNFNESPGGDVRKLTNLPCFDVLLAGFPCQPFSHSGVQRGFFDTRGTMFFEVARLLKESKPEAFLLENVQGLLTNDKGRTFSTILDTLDCLGYGVEWRLLNTCNFGVPQNRQRVYIVGLRGRTPKLTLLSDKGPPDSHAYKKMAQGLLFRESNYPKISVKDVLQSRVPAKYQCSREFKEMLSRVVGDDFTRLNGVRLIDYRNGNSIHSWELGLKGACTPKEVDFMNLLIANRRRHVFGRHQDGKKLTLSQIETFYPCEDVGDVIAGLITKGYLKKYDDKYDPVCGNMSFEVFKFLDPESISITLTSSDAFRIGVVQRNSPRRITPRECARLQGFPDDFLLHPDDRWSYKQIGNSVSVPVVQAVICDFLQNNFPFSGVNRKRSFKAKVERVR
jgi:DNA (cytosine-5)-methyltransferase 1